MRASATLRDPSARTGKEHSGTLGKELVLFQFVVRKRKSTAPNLILGTNPHTNIAFQLSSLLSLLKETNGVKCHTNARGHCND